MMRWWVVVAGVLIAPCAFAEPANEAGPAMLQHYLASVRQQRDQAMSRAADLEAVAQELQSRLADWQKYAAPLYAEQKPSAQPH